MLNKVLIITGNEFEVARFNKLVQKFLAVALWKEGAVLVCLNCFYNVMDTEGNLDVVEIGLVCLEVACRYISISF